MFTPLMLCISMERMYFSAMHNCFTVYTSIELTIGILRASVHGTVHSTVCTKVDHVEYHWKGLVMPYSELVNLVSFYT